MSLIDAIDASERQVKKFGLMFGLIALLVAVYSLVRGGDLWPWAALAALVFVVAGLWIVPVLRPLYKGWMLFAYLLGWINTRLLLGLFFFCMLTPIALVLRLTGRDLLGRKLDRSLPTYWIRREHREFRREQYERLFS